MTENKYVAEARRRADQQRENENYRTAQHEAFLRKQDAQRRLAEAVVEMVAAAADYENYPDF